MKTLISTIALVASVSSVSASSWDYDYLAAGYSAEQVQTMLIVSNKLQDKYFDEKKALEVEVEDLQADFVSYIASQDNEVSALNNDIIGLTNTVSQLQDYAIELETQNSEKTNTIGGLEAMIEAANNSNFKNQFDHIKGIADNSHATISSWLNDNTTVINAQGAGLTWNVNKLIQKAEKRGQQIINLRAVNDDQAETITNLESVNVYLQDQVDTAYSALVTANANADYFERTLADTNEVLADTNSLLNAANLSIGNALSVNANDSGVAHWDAAVKTGHGWNVVDLYSLNGEVRFSYTNNGTRYSDELSNWSDSKIGGKTDSHLINIGYAHGYRDGFAAGVKAVKAQF